MELLLPVIVIVVGFVTLVWGADKFVMGAAALARGMGISPLVVGLTIVGLGTSMPEMLVSGIAAAQDSSGIGIGNALGSNIANIGLVLGVACLVRPICVPRSILRRELPILLLTVIVASLLMVDGELLTGDGIVLASGLAVMLGWVVWEGIKQREVAPELTGAGEGEVESGLAPKDATFWLVLGLGVLLASSHGLVWAATELAVAFGVSDLAIGLTVIAIGTSLPELAASVVAALKDEHELAVGNVVGSNMFNTLGVLALPGIIDPGAVDVALVARDCPVMVGLTVLVILGGAFGGGSDQPGRLGRVAGGVFVVSWLVYLVSVYMVKADDISLGFLGG